MMGSDHSAAIARRQGFAIPTERRVDDIPLVAYVIYIKCADDTYSVYWSLPVGWEIVMKISKIFWIASPPPPRLNKLPRCVPILSIPVVLLLFACNDPYRSEAGLQKLALVYPSSDNVVIKNTALAPLTPTLTPAGTRAAYTIGPAAPAWLAFNPATGAISATAATTKDAPVGRTEYFITATGTGAYAGQNARAKVAITVIEAALTGVKYYEGPLRATAGSGAVLNRTATLLPADAAGDVTYTITPALPTGLSLDPVSGTISGTPTRVSAAKTYTITATGKRGTLYQGAKAATAIAIEVAPAGFGAIAYNDTSPLSETARIAATGTAIPSRTIAAPTGAGHTNVTYAIHPNLTANTGLSFDPANGTISGTPSTVAATATTYTVTATGNSGTIYEGATQTTALSVRVNPAAFTAKYAGRSSSSIFSILSTGTGDGSSPAQALTFTLATTHINASLFPLLRIPGVTGSPGILLPTLATYSITPNTLNTSTGLTFDSSTGRIEGNASMRAASATTYAITATGKTGTIYAGYKVTVYISITIT